MFIKFFETTPQDIMLDNPFYKLKDMPEALKAALNEIKEYNTESEIEKKEMLKLIVILRWFIKIRDFYFKNDEVGKYFINEQITYI